MIRDILLNKWFFTFIIGWVVLLLLVDWSTFSKNIWGGIAAIILEIWQDLSAYYEGLYYMEDQGISLFSVSVFFTFGIAFTMGVVFSQYLPAKPKLQLIHIITFSIGFVIFELTVEAFDMIVEINWNVVASFFDNLVILGSIVWLKYFVIHKSNSNICKTKTE